MKTRLGPLFILLIFSLTFTPLAHSADDKNEEFEQIIDAYAKALNSKNTPEIEENFKILSENPEIVEYMREHTIHVYSVYKHHEIFNRIQSIKERHDLGPATSFYNSDVEAPAIESKGFLRGFKSNSTRATSNPNQNRRPNNLLRRTNNDLNPNRVTSRNSNQYRAHSQSNQSRLRRNRP